MTIEELKSALDSMSTNKAPGLDGIPPELLKILWDIIAPLILNSLNFALETGALHRDQNPALIVLLLKKENLNALVTGQLAFCLQILS